MGGACNTRGRGEKFLQSQRYIENLKEGDDLRDPDVDGQIIKTFLKREQYGLMMFTGFISHLTDKFGNGSFVRVWEWTHEFFTEQFDVTVRVCTYILESLGSIRDRDSAYPYSGFSWFFHPFQINATLVPRIGYGHMHIRLSNLCSLRYSAINWISYTGLLCVIVSWVSLRIFKMGVQGRGGVAACIVDLTLPRDNGFSIHRFLCPGLVCRGRGVNI